MNKNTSTEKNPINQSVAHLILKQNEAILPLLTLEKVDKAYSSTPIWYDIRGFLILKLAYRSSLIGQIKFFSANMGPSHLEAAIGTASLFDLILKWKALTRQTIGQIEAFDYAKRMLAGAQAKLNGNPNVHLMLADVGKLPYPDLYFDTANVANAIHCFPDVDSGFKEIYRTLKVNGTFAGNVLLYPVGNGLFSRIAKRINAWGTRKGILNRPYYDQEIKSKLLTAGFSIVTTERIGNCFNFVAVKSESKTYHN